MAWCPRQDAPTSAVMQYRHLQTPSAAATNKILRSPEEGLPNQPRLGPLWSHYALQTIFL